MERCYKSITEIDWLSVFVGLVWFVPSLVDSVVGFL